MPLRISLVHRFEQQQAETVGLQFSLDGTRLVSTDGTAVYLWRLNESRSWEYERSLPFRYARQPSFTLDGKGLAFGDYEGIFQLISLEDEKEKRALPFPSRTNCAFSPDQRWLATGDMNRNILLWDLLTYQSSIIPLPFPGFGEKLEDKKTDQPNESIENVKFIPDGQRLAIGAANTKGYGYIYICYFDLTHKQLLRQETIPHGCIDLAISPNGKVLATIDVKIGRGPLVQEIYIYDLDSFQLLHIFSQRDEDRYCLLAFSPDGHCLASCKESGIVDLFSLKPFEQIVSFAAHPGLATEAMDPIGGLDWSKTGFIATGGASEFKSDRKKTDYTIKIWKVEEE